jgi:hypothetical protein
MIAVALRQRTIAGVWFGAAAFAASALLYLAPAAHGGVPAVLLYLACPTISGLAAGWLIGHKVLAAATPGRASLLGAAVALLAHAVYAPLYVLASASIPGSHDRPLPLALSVLTIGTLMTGPVTLPIGALTGFVLFRASRRGSLQPQALDC